MIVLNKTFYLYTTQSETVLFTTTCHLQDSFTSPRVRFKRTQIRITECVVKRM